MTDIDFNILHYSNDELLQFLGLKKDCTYNDLMNSYHNMIYIVDTNNHYELSYKTKLKYFLDEVREKLLDQIIQVIHQEENLLEKEELLNTAERENIVNKTSVATYNGSHVIQNKETTSFNQLIDREKYLDPVETFPTNISRSLLNNVKRKTIHQTIILNSLYREDYNKTWSTDFTIFLPYYFKNVFSIRLSSIQLPNVMYCISRQNRNNSFYIAEDETTLQNIIVIPDGNYSPSNFATTLQTLINNGLNSGNRFLVIVNPVTFKVTISNTTYTFTMNFLKDYNPAFNTADTYAINKEYKEILCVNVNVTEIYKRLGWIMGFRLAAYSGKNSYTGEGIYNGAASTYLYFTMNDYNNSQSQNIIGMFSQSLIIDNILAMIPLSQSIDNPNINYNICFNNGSDYIEKKREYFGPVNIQKLKFQLLNQYGETINLNNMDFSFSLEFESAYDW